MPAPISPISPTRAKSPPVPAPLSPKCRRQNHPTADGPPLLDTGTAMDIRTGSMPALPVQQIRRFTTGSHAGSPNPGGALAQLQTGAKAQLQTVHLAWVPYSRLTHPTADGPLSSNDGALSSNDGALSSNDGALSSNDGALSSNDGPLNSNDGPQSSNDGPQSSNDGPQSSNDGPQSSNDGALSSNDGPQSSTPAQQWTLEPATCRCCRCRQPVPTRWGLLSLPESPLAGDSKRMETSQKSSWALFFFLRGEI